MIEFPNNKGEFGLGYEPSDEELFQVSRGKKRKCKMANEDKAKITFTTHWGTYAYDVMPFGLKNTGATYQ